MFGLFSGGMSWWGRRRRLPALRFADPQKLHWTHEDRSVVCAWLAADQWRKLRARMVEMALHEALRGRRTREYVDGMLRCIEEIENHGPQETERAGGAVPDQAGGARRRRKQKVWATWPLPAAER